MEVFFGITTFLFGLVFGSFLNVCIHRLPREQSVVAPRSACPNCKTPIAGYDNIPLLSWLILRGRCRQCKAPISVRYPLVELLHATLWLACYLKFGLALITLKYCIFSFLILGLVFIDAEWKLLPDVFTLPGIAMGLAFSVLVPVNDLVYQLLPWLPISTDVRIPWRLLSFGDSLLGAAVGASFIYGVGVAYLRARGVEGMGFGDVKLMGMVGAFLGVKMTIITIFGASLLGSAYGLGTILVVWMKRSRRRVERNHETPDVARRRAWHSAMQVYRFYQVPFGSFLGAVAMLALFFGNQALRLYWKTF